MNHHNIKIEDLNNILSYIRYLNDKIAANAQPEYAYATATSEELVHELSHFVDLDQESEF
ncbi:MAG: hypothetical protein MI748_14385 [Opitutales bacterium]|nr:hypothetical protein [Opitutales bacterium]